MELAYVSSLKIITDNLCSPISPTISMDNMSSLSPMPPSTKAVSLNPFVKRLISESSSGSSDEDDVGQLPDSSPLIKIATFTKSKVIINLLIDIEYGFCTYEAKIITKDDSKITRK